MPEITLKNPCLRVIISTKGAEMQSIVDAHGEERLWNGDPAFWTGRAPVLFPVAGGLREDGYRLDGQWYPMQKHGFARGEEWALESADDTSATFLLTAQKPGFPFEYAFRATYRLEENRIRVSYQLENLDRRIIWASMGGHEAYTCPGGVEEYQIVFDEPETLMHHPLEGNLIHHEGVCLGENTRTLNLNEELLANDALVFFGLKSTGVTLQKKDGSRPIRVDFAGNPTIMFWHKPGAPYLCIESWNNHPDFVDAPLDITQKPDYIGLEPGGKAAREHIITIG